MSAVLLIAGLRITARVVFAVTGPAGLRFGREAQLKFPGDGSTRQQQDLVAATSSKTSKARDDRASRFHVKKSSKTDSASVISIVHSVERDRIDRHRGSERRHYPGRVNVKATEADSAGLPGP